PDFELVAQPSDWIAQVRALRGGGSGDGELSALRSAQLSFWNRYLDYLRQDHPTLTNVRKPQVQNWLTLNFVRGLGIAAVFASDGTIRCEIYIDVGDGEKNMRIFSALKERQPEIEAGIGESLFWDRLEGRRACRISISTPGSPLGDDTDTLIRWLGERHLKFHRVIVPMIRILPDELWK
ncbi:DUF4268 domain-containing protein, partial [bacterium]|nr:DUF4268 domain-containing protein [bacterium]